MRINSTNTREQEAIIIIFKRYYNIVMIGIGNLVISLVVQLLISLPIFGGTLHRM